MKWYHENVNQPAGVLSLGSLVAERFRGGGRGKAISNKYNAIVVSTY